MGEIKRNIKDTIDVLHGLRAEDEDTAKTFECLQSNMTPISWLSICYPSFKTLSVFIDNLMTRAKYIYSIVNQFNGWKKGKDNETRTYMLPYFYD